MSIDNRSAGISDNPTASRQIALIKSSEPIYNDEGNVVVESFTPVVQYMQKVVSSQPKTLNETSLEVQGAAVTLPADQSTCWVCAPGDRPRVALVVTLYKDLGLALPADFTSITLQPFLGLYSPSIPEVSLASFEVQAPLPSITITPSDFVQVDDADSAMSKILIVETYGFPSLGIAVTELTTAADTVSLAGYPC